MEETNRFLSQQVEALKLELEKKNRELEENNQLLKFYEQQLYAKPEQPQKRLTERFPACYQPLSELELS